MQWSKCYAAAIAVGVFAATETTAFVPLSVSKRKTTLHAGGLGWDNEDFLESLGKGSEELNKANERYYDQSRFGRPSNNDDDEDGPLFGGGAPPAADDEDDLTGKGTVQGAELTKEMIEKVKKQNEQQEEGSQGGKMLQELLARAQGRSSSLSAAVPPPPPPPTQPTVAPTANFDNLTVEQQAEMFRQLMAGQQPQVPPPPVAAVYPPQQFPAQGIPVDPSGRKAGRNRDADAIVNTSDLYFAQLKLDSSVRNLARYSGDVEKANKPFSDPKVHELRVHVNPYLEESRKKERELLETSAEESLAWQILAQQEADELEKMKGSSGVSYKQKLQERMQKRKGSDTTTTTPQEPPKPAEAVITHASPVQEEEPMVEPTQEFVGQATPVQDVAPLEYTPPVEAPPAIAKVVPPPTPSVPPITIDSSEDEKRSSIRTLMGMLLKHRGGPGFGAGRLQGDAVGKFEQAVDNLMAVLKQEALANPTPAELAAGSSTVTQPQSGAAVSVDNMITCIQGAIQVYKNSPPEIWESVVVTLRAALLAALNTLNDALSPDAPAVPPGSNNNVGDTASAWDRIDRMISVIEGAVTMYRNSPPELHQPVLVTLRASLLTAVTTLNGVIADNEVKNQQAYQAAAPQATQPNAVGAPVASEPTKPTLSGNDPNSQFLEGVYAKLKDAKGEGKMGLKADLSGSQAAELANDLAKMRSMLVEELETGIPDGTKNGAPSSSSATPDSPSWQSSSASKYQEMLAKARAEKDAKKEE